MEKKSHHVIDMPEHKPYSRIQSAENQIFISHFEVVMRADAMALYPDPKTHCHASIQQEFSKVYGKLSST